MNDKPSLEMDAVTAHLDRGWNLLHHGELDAARLSADHILTLDPESPEGHTLLGAIAAAAGEFEDALELFKQAIDLDTEYLDAYLYAAELSVHPLGNYREALKLCAEAEALAQEPEEILDVHLLYIEAWLVAEDLKQAGLAAKKLPLPPYPAGHYYLRAGRALLGVGQIEQAIPLLEEAVKDREISTDGRYFLAVALEHADRPVEALGHFLIVHEEDRALPEPPWATSSTEFEQLVKDTLASLAPGLNQLVKDVMVKILENPSIELIAEGFDPRGMVFLSGLPAIPARAQAQRRGRRVSEQLQVQPTCLFLYKRNIERFSPSSDDVPGELKDALEKELTLFFNPDSGY